jgi:hypothetical protein
MAAQKVAGLASAAAEIVRPLFIPAISPAKEPYIKEIFSSKTGRPHQHKDAAEAYH